MPVLALPDCRLLPQVGFHLAALWSWGLELMEQHSQSTMVTTSLLPGDGRASASVAPFSLGRPGPFVSSLGLGLGGLGALLMGALSMTSPSCWGL